MTSTSDGKPGSHPPIGHPPIDGAERMMFGPIAIDVAPVGAARLKRVVYPPGSRWSRDVKSISGTDLCEHAHGGYLAEGSMQFEFADGCVQAFTAPCFVEVAPGHDAVITSEVPAVLIEVDFLGDTIERLGLPAEHTH